MVARVSAHLNSLVTRLVTLRADGVLLLLCSEVFRFVLLLLQAFTYFHHTPSPPSWSNIISWGLLLSRNSTKITFCCHSIHGSARQPSLVERAKKCMICRQSPKWMPLRLGITASPRASKRVLRRTRTGWTVVVFLHHFAPYSWWS